MGPAPAAGPLFVSRTLLCQCGPGMVTGRPLLCFAQILPVADLSDPLQRVHRERADHCIAEVLVETVNDARTAGHLPREASFAVFGKMLEVAGDLTTIGVLVDEKCRRSAVGG